MKRKVNQVGTGTLTVSLPNKWVEKHNIKKGDEVDVDESGNSLTIAKNCFKSNEIKEIEVKFTLARRRYIRSTIGVLYKKGYDLLKIKYDDEKVFKIIEDSVNNLIGYEIFDKSKGQCIVKSLIINPDDPTKEFENMVNKILNSIKTTSMIAREDYVSGKHDRLDELVTYRHNGWRFRDYAMRIAFNSFDDSPKKQALINIIWSLEKINRNYMHFYEEMKNITAKKDEKLLQIYDEVYEYVTLLSRLIQKTAMSDVEELNEKYNAIFNKLLLFINKTKNASLCYFLMENIRRVQDTGSNLVQIHF